MQKEKNNFSKLHESVKAVLSFELFAGDSLLGVFLNFDDRIKNFDEPLPAEKEFNQILAEREEGVMRFLAYRNNELDSYSQYVREMSSKIKELNDQVLGDKKIWEDFFSDASDGLRVALHYIERLARLYIWHSSIVGGILRALGPNAQCQEYKSPEGYCYFANFEHNKIPKILLNVDLKDKLVALHDDLGDVVEVLKSLYHQCEGVAEKAEWYP